MRAMREGIDVIAQGAVGNAQLYGRPDILLRVDSRECAWPMELRSSRHEAETGSVPMDYLQGSQKMGRSTRCSVVQKVMRCSGRTSSFRGLLRGDLNQDALPGFRGISDKPRSPFNVRTKSALGRCRARMLHASPLHTTTNMAVSATRSPGRLTTKIVFLLPAPAKATLYYTPRPPES